MYGEALSRTPAVATKYDVSDAAARMTVEEAVSRFSAMQTAVVPKQQQQ
jgi:hypothetical protein